MIVDEITNGKLLSVDLLTTDDDKYTSKFRWVKCRPKQRSAKSTNPFTCGATFGRRLNG